MWEWFKSMQVDRKDFARKFVRGMYRKPQSEEYLNRITAASLKAPTNTAVTLLGNVLASSDMRPVLTKIDRPVLYTVTAPLKAQGEMLRQKVPAARVEVFEEAGHALFVDDAERFNRVVEEWLREPK